MDVDEALKAVNPLGRAQILTVLYALLATFAIGFLVLSTLFNAEIPPHHCALHHGRTLNESIPMTDDHQYSSCKEFVNQTASGDTQTCSQGWEYDTELMGTSITSEWNLVCSQGILRDLSQTLLLCGFAIGSLIGGPIADRYGRKRPIMYGLVLYNIAGIASAFSPYYAIFVCLRFLMGLIWKVIQIPLLTLLFENLLPRHRPTLGNVPLSFYSISLVTMAGIAYLVRDWREFTIVMMTPSILMMLFSWLLPESIRWAASQGKLEKTKSVLRKMAKFNKVNSIDWSFLDKPSMIPAGTPTQDVTRNQTSNIPVEASPQDVTPRNQISSIPVDASTQDVTHNQTSNIPVDTSSQDVTRKQNSSKSAAHENNSKFQGATLLQLFKKPTRTVSVILCWFWMSYTFGYFGFALTTGTLAGDPYINFILSGLVEFPARILPLFIVKKTGNLLLLLCSFGTASFVMIGVIIVRYLINQSEVHDLDWLLTTLALLGKFFSTFVFVPLFLCTTELFPTTVRNSGTGFVQLIGNIGSLSSPLLIYLDNSVFNLPFIIMASFALVSAFLCLFLPETLNVTQPETPADLQKLFETKLFLKNIKKTFQCEGGNRKSDDTEMTEKYSKGNDNPGFEA